MFSFLTSNISFHGLDMAFISQNGQPRAWIGSPVSRLYVQTSQVESVAFLPMCVWKIIKSLQFPSIPYHSIKLKFTEQYSISQVSMNPTIISAGLIKNQLQIIPNSLQIQKYCVANSKDKLYDISKDNVVSHLSHIHGPGSWVRYSW